MTIKVFARWRPLLPSEAGHTEIDHKTLPGTHPLLSMSIQRQSSTQGQSWTSSTAFNEIFNPEDGNQKVYEKVVAPNIHRILAGENCSLLAYGHSGSGKTHTILGYEAPGSQELGLCLAAAKQLFDALVHINEKSSEEMGIGFSLFELRNKSALDLLNHRNQCHIREGADGKVHIRGQTEILEDGKVRVRPIVQRHCWRYESFQHELSEALRRRATGSSSVHDQSSRTHAVLELEIVNRPLVNARNALFDRQSELVPVGKRAIDIMVEEETKSIMRTTSGDWAPNPEYRKNYDRINAIETEKAQFEARVAGAEAEIERIKTSSSSPCLGAKMVFVDLAGAEYYEGNGRQAQNTKQTPQERQEGRQINTDLLALKEVMRAWSQGKSRIPFRSSSLTMVLREHFTSTQKMTAIIIVTVSPAAEMYAATLNSLKYANLVGSISA